jgi:TPR repeat protein
LGDKSVFLSSQKMILVIGALMTAFLLFSVVIYVFSKPESIAKNYPQSDSPDALNSVKSISSLLQSAEKGDAKAQYELGQALLKESGGTAKKTAIAVLWLNKSVSKGNVDAMVALGRLSKTGMGVLQSYAQALKWIQTAANLGSPDGMLELGRLYRDGVAVERDSVQAYIWMNRAAAMQNPAAAKERDLIARALTADKLKEAQSLSTLDVQVKPQ